ncbi:MAG: hypothetical protein HUK25_03400, partial [Treponema sp.]|nr:hypothetical protein [Treponema sp.]
MADLQDYIAWRGDLSFEVAPFNKIDALVLCQITYLDFTGYLSKDFKEKKTLGNLVDSMSEDDFKNVSKD